MKNPNQLGHILNERFPASNTDILWHPIMVELSETSHNIPLVHLHESMMIGVAP